MARKKKEAKPSEDVEESQIVEAEESIEEEAKP